MELDAEWIANMAKGLMAFKQAAESAWAVLESCGVTVEKLVRLFFLTLLTNSGMIERD